MVLRLGRFFARSITSTSVPISGPSTLISEKIPAVCIPLSGCVFALVVVMFMTVVPRSAVPWGFEKTRGSRKSSWERTERGPINVEVDRESRLFTLPRRDGESGMWVE